MKGYYSLGLYGYEISIDPTDNDYAFAQFMGTEKEHPRRRYKINFSTSGRTFIRPNRRRVYLDEVLRT